MKLITHNQKFHYDEILATAVLQTIFPNTKVIRTRDEEVIKTGDIVYDVGRVYDPSRHRYDHHQNTFNDCFSPKYKIKLSSAGLVFKHFHEELFEKYGMKKGTPIFEDMVDKVYSEFFLPADAIDNGYDCTFGEIKVRSVADVVDQFNSYSETDTEADAYARFMSALKIVAADLHNYLEYVLQDYAVSYESMYHKIKDFNGEIFIIEKRIPNSVIFELNEKLNKDLKYVIYKGERESRIYTIPKVIGKFGIKYPLHSDWRGLVGDELDKISGIPNCVFVHSSGFTGGNTTLDGAIEMCKKSLKHLNDTDGLGN